MSKSETPSAESEPVADARPIDTRTVRKLADILNATGLTEIEVEQGDLKIRVSRGAVSGAVVAAPSPVAYAAAPAPAAAPAAPPAAAPAPAAAAPAPVAGELVKSPMVGTVYLAPAPGANTFVKVGDSVTAGQTLLIIEAMKTMNPIPAPKAGKVVEIVAQDGQPVEFGEGLVVID
jgi:acetyl-CoA carboxylase biotin carboxyl carrier protein